MNTIGKETSQDRQGQHPKWASFVEKWGPICDWIYFAGWLIAGVILLIIAGRRMANDPGDYVSKDTMSSFVFAFGCLFAASFLRPSVSRRK